MTEPATSAQATETQLTQKEVNFRKQEMMFQRQLEQERAARLQAEKEAEELRRRSAPQDDDEDDQPYVDKKQLNKTLQKHSQQSKQETQSEIQRAVQTALVEERKQSWLKNNKDFYEVLNHAEKLALKDPELAESILEMPDTFERQKLVYKNIKALELHKPEAKQPSIQEKVDANRRSPYYQPSGVGSSPYAASGDFSAAGQKQAYDKLQELKSRLRI